MKCINEHCDSKRKRKPEPKPCNCTNFLKETIEQLEFNDKTEQDVLYVQEKKESKQ